MYPNTLLYPLLYETNLVPTSTLQDDYQRLYTYRLLSLLDQHPVEGILPVSLRVRDTSSQLKELPDDTFT